MQIDWKAWFDRALPYDEFLNTHGNDMERSRWQAAYDRVRLTEEQQSLLQGFVREMNVLVLAGTWCSDCVQQVPALHRFAQASDRIRLRVLDRDSAPELRDTLKINGGARVPLVVFLSEDFFECARYGDRVLSLYRQVAHDFLDTGRPTNIASSGEELTARVVADWLHEFERVQLMLRLSPRLREKHGD